MREKFTLKSLKPARITVFEQEGDVVTRKVYKVDEDGSQTLYHESVHSAASLQETADEIFAHNKAKQKGV